MLSQFHVPKLQESSLSASAMTGKAHLVFIHLDVFFGGEGLMLNPKMEPARQTNPVYHTSPVG